MSGNPYDENLQVATSLSETDIVWFDGSKAPFRFFGRCEELPEEPFHRLPSRIYEQVSPGLAWHAPHTSGVRLRFATDSPYITLQVKWPYLCHMSHFALTGSSGFDLYSCDRGLQQYVATFVPPNTATEGYESIVRVAGGKMTEYVLNLPLYNPVDTLYIGIKEGFTITPGTETYRNDKPVVFYGSSITQGGCASRPGNSYENILSRRFNMDYINLGFSGNAKGEQIMCDYMAGLDMAVFVSDYDYNAPTAEHLESTHYNLYETIRAKHPDIPYIMVSRPGMNNPPDDSRRLCIIGESYRRAWANGDKNVYFICGNDFFHGDVADSCTVDGCHPTDLGFYFMAEGMSKILKSLL